MFKCSKDQKYIRNSIYKCFGYIFDSKVFLNLLKKPHIILAIEDLKDSKFEMVSNNNPLLIVTWKTLFNETDSYLSVKSNFYNSFRD
ncbi:MAG: hypothetical protein BAJALOKI1v1_1870002 [Promethearchaeota archaeon]|nr:MAG: hypothetical protein BAJALOKI1v1_1870002 [Candidatus Lokiarchaeota archaeon]